MLAACLIFDMDGTLVDSTGLDDALYTTAIRGVLGDLSPCANWPEYEHVTTLGSSSKSATIVGLCWPMRRRRRESASANAGRQSCGPRARAGRRRVPSASGIGSAPTSNSSSVSRRENGAHGADEARCRRIRPRWRGTDMLGWRPREHGAHAAMPRVTPARAATAVFLRDGDWDLVAANALGWRFLGVGQRLKGTCLEWIAGSASIDSLDRIRRAPGDLR